MPTTIYLRSGDEFTVTQPYAVALDRWSSRTPSNWLAEFTALYWRNPKHMSDEEEWPAYRESPVTVDLSTVVAVERVDRALADEIAKAREFEADRADQN